MASSNVGVQIGLEQISQSIPSVMRGARLGLLMNQSSVDYNLRYSCDVLSAAFPGKLTTLFTPQHGLWGEQQANMIESSHTTHPQLGIPVHSLYSETRKPTPAMLKHVDCFVVDLQDVGTRVYTFIWTISHCLEACAEAGIPVVILDRPNPLGGDIVEGPMLEVGQESFVGRACIPMRHGLTLGELSSVVNHLMQIGAEIHVIPIAGWHRNMNWNATGRKWVWPSPNVPRPESCVVYPGMVLLEGTNLSEGRGTTMPFEVFGAPFVDPHVLASKLREFSLPGVAFLPLRFVPTFDKWQGVSCGGLLLDVTDADTFQPVLTSVLSLAVIRSLWPKDFDWLPPPYEYETEKPPIDIIAGTVRLRMGIDALETGEAPTRAKFEELIAFDQTAWQELCRPYLIY